MIRIVDRIGRVKGAVGRLIGRVESARRLPRDRPPVSGGPRSPGPP